jgi:hypothetical protein
MHGAKVRTGLPVIVSNPGLDFLPLPGRHFSELTGLVCFLL